MATAFQNTFTAPAPGLVPSQRLALDNLPPPGTTRWVARRKAEVLGAIDDGVLSAAEACARWDLSVEELALWRDCIDRAGVPGLRVTRIQHYRGYDQRLLVRQ
jgi:hypothetical protein